MDDETLLPSSPVSANSNGLPFAREVVILTKQAHIELKCEINQYKTLFHRALDREKELKKQLDQEKAKVRDLNQRLYGRKTEKSTRSEKTTSPAGSRPPRRPRGQQRGSRGHGRTPRPHLPIVEETRDIPEADKVCQDCGLLHPDLVTTDDSEIIEIEVRSYVRKIRRKKYGHCGCRDKKGMITAPPAPRLIPRSSLGLSVWVEILLHKYQYAQATNRQLQDLSSLGCPISQGTVTGGLKRLAPIFEPLVERLLRKHFSEDVFHGDETGWNVFEQTPDKKGHRWYLWITQSTSVVYYQMAPGRNAAVPIAHFSGLDSGQFRVFLVCDRYSAYKKLSKDIPRIVLCFCWAHVRRDFLEAARRWPELQAWMFEWVGVIGELYHLNDQRLAHWDEDKALGEQSSEFKHFHQGLRKKLQALKTRCDQCLQQADLHDAQQSVLSSLNNHWSGLTVFARYPQVAMDNNTAERSLRNPVTGRKRFYGSGRIWSAHLAALMFSVLQTLLLWGINQRHWLTAYLTVCAENGGRAPSDLSAFLPWEMVDERLSALQQPRPMSDLDQARLWLDTG